MATIVSTLRIGETLTEPVFSFITYHIAVGFEHIYLFFDHESNFDLADLVQSKFGTKFVTCFKRSEDLLLKQKISSKHYVKLAQYLDSEVPARQTVNAEYAYHIASAAGYRWMLHIDIDELFYISGSDPKQPGHSSSRSDFSEAAQNNSVECFDVNDHFSYLDEIGAQCMTYVNHEGVPEQFDTSDYFHTTTLFRKHHFNIPFNTSTSKCINFWKNRTTYDQYFLVYDNGKSAVKLGLNGAYPRDVHRWMLPEIEPETKSKNDSTSLYGMINNDNSNNNDDKNYSSSSRSITLRPEEDMRYRTALMDPRTLQVKRLLRIDQPCILHFVTCGYGWLLDKYQILGSFPNFWFGDKLPIAPSFHLNARDVVLGRTSESPTITTAVADTAAATTVVAHGGGGAAVADTSAVGIDKHTADLLNTAKFYMQQVMLNCQSPTDAIADIATVFRKFIPQKHWNKIDEMLLSFQSTTTRVIVDCSAERDHQINQGVLLRLDRVQQILNAAKHCEHEIETVSTDDTGGSYGQPKDSVTSGDAVISQQERFVKRLRHAAAKVPVEDMHASVPPNLCETFVDCDTRGKNSTCKIQPSVVSTRSNSGGDVSELDRLRIISQVALNFL